MKDTVYKLVYSLVKMFCINIGNTNLTHWHRKRCRTVPTASTLQIKSKLFLVSLSSPSLSFLTCPADSSYITFVLFTIWIALQKLIRMIELFITLNKLYSPCFTCFMTHCFIIYFFVFRGNTKLINLDSMYCSKNL